MEEKWLTIKEFAAKMNITPSAVSHWFRTKPEIKEKYTKPLNRKSWLIKESLLTEYVVVKGTQGNGEESSLIKFAKDKLVEIAKPMVISFNDPVLLQLEQLKQLRLSQLNQENRINNIEQELKEVKQLTLESPPEKMTNPQREFLNERVRYYATTSGLPHWKLWNDLHSAVGRQSINDYKFEDYKVAMKHLKNWYTLAKLEWPN